MRIFKDDTKIGRDINKDEKDGTKDYKRINAKDEK